MRRQNPGFRSAVRPARLRLSLHSGAALGRGRLREPRILSWQDPEHSLGYWSLCSEYDLPEVPAGAMEKLFARVRYYGMGANGGSSERTDEGGAEFEEGF